MIHLLTPELVFLLVGIAILAGICTAAIGPGGIVLTIALFTLLSLSAAEVAATASATFVATGALGTIAYYRSGEFDIAGVREVVFLLSTTAIAGAPVGTQLNLLVPEYVFAWLLALVVMAVGVLIMYRTVFELQASYRLMTAPPHQRRVLLGVIGFCIGILGSMLGVGGPVIAVPILVVLGMPMLVALAAAQLQSVFVSGFAVMSYATVGAVSISVVLLVGIPQLAGVVVGWKVAHRIDADRLKLILATVLVAVAPAIVL